MANRDVRGELVSAVQDHGWENEAIYQNLIGQKASGLRSRAERPVIVNCGDAVQDSHAQTSLDATLENCM